MDRSNCTGIDQRRSQTATTINNASRLSVCRDDAEGLNDALASLHRNFGTQLRCP